MNVQQHDFPLLVTLLVAAATPALGQIITPAVELPNSATQSVVSLPDFSGIWAHLSCCGFELPLSGLGPVTNRSYPYRVGDYTNPILKPQAAEVVKKRGEISLSGVTVLDPASQCWPGGVPFIFWNTGIQIIQQPHQITILYSNDHEVRRIRMNETHSARVTPSWYGDSVGHYEGNTLVIDTLGIIFR